MKADYLVVGAGPFGCAFARTALDNGKRVVIVDKRPHVGGNAADAIIDGQRVHLYGLHVFHTNDDSTWRFMERFGAMIEHDHHVKARYSNKIYTLPISLQTFYEVYGVSSPSRMRELIVAFGERARNYDLSNFENWVVSQVGREMFETIYKGYSEKQWGRPCDQIPVSIARRIPIRINYDTRYFSDRYQGYPKDGYTKLFENMLFGADVRLGVDFLTDREHLMQVAHKVVFSGPIDAFYDHQFGRLEYRSLRFEHAHVPDYQGALIFNHPDPSVAYTRTMEWRYLPGGFDGDLITREFPSDTGDPYYPIPTEENRRKLGEYKRLAEHEKNVWFGGRLGTYNYYDMHQVIAQGRAMFAQVEAGVR